MSIINSDRHPKHPGAYPRTAHLTESRQSPRNPSIMKKLGESAIARNMVLMAAVASTALTGLSGAAEGRLYPNNQPIFTDANDAKNSTDITAPTQGITDNASNIVVDRFNDNSAEKDFSEDLFLFFPGFGNVSDHFAEEFNEAMGRQVNAFYLKQANQGLLINETADKLRILIEEQKPKYINIVCTSMGFNTALETIVALLKANPELEIPPIKYLVPNSSPASIEDAMDGRAADVSGIKQINPGIPAKGFWSAVDSKWDIAKATNLRNKSGILGHLFIDSVKQTLNHSPPKLDWDRIKLLGGFDLDEIAKVLIERGVITPETTIIYLKAANDDTVKQDDAIAKIKAAFKGFKVVVIDTPANHANTVEGTKALVTYLLNEETDTIKPPDTYTYYAQPAAPEKPRKDAA